MTDNVSLQDLFAKGMTREQFIAKYGEIENGKTKPNSSVFAAGMGDSIGKIFDTLNTNGNDMLDEGEISALKAMGIGDDKNHLSEKDLQALYQKVAQSISSQYTSTDPKTMYEGSIKPFENRNESTYAQDLKNQIEILEELITLREANSNNIVSKLQAQLNDFIQKNLTETTEENKNFKDEYNSKTQEIERLKKESLENTRKLQEAELNQHETQSEIEIIKKEIEALDPEKDKDEINNKQGEISSLQSKADMYSQDVATFSEQGKELNSKISSLRNDLNSMTDSIQDKLKSLGADKKAKIKDINDKINAEEKSAENDIKLYKQQLETLKNAYDYAIKQMEMSSSTESGDDASLHNNDGKFNFKDVNYSSEKGQKLAQYMKSHAHGFTGHCARSVRLGLQGTGLGTEGAASAWMMADKLRRNQNYKEVKINNVQELRSLPAGCIIVYAAGAAGYNAKHGHIEVSLGNGTCASDGITRNPRFTQNMSVFVPVA